MNHKLVWKRLAFVRPDYALFHFYIKIREIRSHLDMQIECGAEKGTEG